MRLESYYLNFRNDTTGNYIYFSTWSIAIDISCLDDRFWNREHLLQDYPELSPVDAFSIVEALWAKNI